MANCCYYDLRAYGKTETVNKCMEFIKSHSPEYEVHDEKLSEDGKTRDVYAHGWCKWSATCAWNLDKFTNQLYLKGVKNVKTNRPREFADKFMQEIAQQIIEESAKNESLLDIKDDISIELYTEEEGMGFAEHYILVNGEIKLDDTRHYEEIYDDEEEFIGHSGGFKVYDFDFDVNKQIPEYDGKPEQYKIEDDKIIKLDDASKDSD